MNNESRKAFVVSYWRDMWPENTKSVFFADQYMRHLVQRDKLSSQFENMEFPDAPDISRESLKKNSDFVLHKCEYYIEILSNRLNIMHGLRYPITFWRKCFCLPMIRYITLFHSAFSVFEKYFDPQKYTCRILDSDTYIVPINFEEHRNIFQSSHFGQEQIFSHYIRLFYPGLYSSISPTRLSNESFERLHPVPARLRKRIMQDCIKKIRKALFLLKNEHHLFFQILFKKIFYITTWFGRRNGDVEKSQEKLVEVGILDSFFSIEHVEHLEGTTNHRISRVYHNIASVDLNLPIVDVKRRESLGVFQPDFDRFDQFFFSTLPYCFPMAFIENFHSILEKCKQFHELYPKIHDLVCEAWGSDTYDSILLAYLKNNYNTIHHNNEHNCLFHQFMGDMCKIQASLVDYFVTMGWTDKKIPNIRRGASLFKFSVTISYEKEYKILFVDYFPYWKICQYASPYSFEGYFAYAYINFRNVFFSKISNETLKKISYRGYPKDYEIKYLAYDTEYLLRDWLPFMHKVSASYDKGETCKEQMARARLVVVPYTSTAYLEALHMNIPVIFFWDPKSTFLAEGHEDTYQPLIEAGICQTDPVKAAAFVEHIKDDPETWWASDTVQNGRKKFMEKFFNPPEVMIAYLKGLL